MAIHAAVQPSETLEQLARPTGLPRACGPRNDANLMLFAFMYTTILKFRRLLERHDLSEQIFAEVGRILLSKGLWMKKGSVVDATLIAAPSSTKNRGRSVTRR